VSLKGIGMQEVGEVVRLSAGEAEISVLEDPKPLTQLLQQERNRSAARNVAVTIDGEIESTTADLVVCEAHTGADAMILVGEWDPVSEEVRRPIQLDGMEAERYGLSVPLSAQGVEQQSSRQIFAPDVVLHVQRTLRCLRQKHTRCEGVPRIKKRVDTGLPWLCGCTRNDGSPEPRRAGVEESRRGRAAFERGQTAANSDEARDEGEGESSERKTLGAAHLAGFRGATGWAAGHP
jgi:hypothetical protein